MNISRWPAALLVIVLVSLSWCRCVADIALQKTIAEGQKLCTSADAFLAQGDPADALKLYQEALALLPESGRAKAGIAASRLAEAPAAARDLQTQPVQPSLASQQPTADVARTTSFQSNDPPQLAVQSGHSRPIQALAFSGDGRLIVTGSDDNTAKVWDAFTGALLRTLPGNDDPICSVCFSPDSKTIVTGSGGGTSCVWDTATGGLLHVLPAGHIVSFSPDGKIILTWGANVVRAWDPATGALLQAVPFNTVGVLALSISRQTAVAVSTNNTESGWPPDAARLMQTLTDGAAKPWSLTINQTLSQTHGEHVRPSQTGNGTAFLRDAASGSVLQTLSAQHGKIWMASISAQTNRVATGCEDGTAQIWNMSTGALLQTLSGHAGAVRTLAFSQDGRYLLTGSVDGIVCDWDVASGALLHTLSTSRQQILAVGFSPDNAKIVTADRDTTARLWDARTGDALATLTGSAKLLSDGVFSPDGRTVAMISDDNSADIWDLRTGTLSHIVSGHTAPIDVVKFSPDGRMLATGSEDKTARLWDPASGMLIHSLVGGTADISSLSFAPNGEQLVTAGGDNTARVWDTSNGALVQTLNAAPSDQIMDVDYSPDGTMLAAGSYSKIILWDTATMSQRFTIPSGPTFAFSPDSQSILTGTFNGAALSQVWETRNGTLLQTLSGQYNAIDNESYSPDGTRFATTSANSRLRDGASGNLICKLPGHALAGCFSPDSKQIVTTNADNSVSLRDAATGAELHRLIGHTGPVSSTSFSIDGKDLITTSWDHTARIWDVSSGALLCSLFVFTNGDWAVVAPDGRFDTNDFDLTWQLHWVTNNGFDLPFSVFLRQYYEPRLLPRLIAHDPALNVPLPSLASLYIQRPTVTIDARPLPDPTDRQRINVTVNVVQPDGTPPTGGSEASKLVGHDSPKNNSVLDLRLFRDGQLVGYAPGDRDGGVVNVGPGGTKTFTFSVRIPQDGRTHMTLSAFAYNCDLVKSDTDRMVYDIPPALQRPVSGRAYLISLGVNTYEDPGWNLRCCAHDANRLLTDMGDRLKSSGQYGAVVRVPLIADSTVGQATATRADFEAVLDKLAGRAPDPAELQKLPILGSIQKAAPEDLVIISFSCHGAADGEGNFYLFPSDIGAHAASWPDEALAEHAISSDDLSYWLRDIDSGQMAMVIDACHSAASVENGAFKPGPMDSRGLGQLAYNKGMRILAASQADDVALENDQIRDGLLTYALTHDGLECRQADANPQDGTITLKKWLQYGVDRVPDLYVEVKKDQINNFGSKDVARGTVLEKRSHCKKPASGAAAAIAVRLQQTVERCGAGEFRAVAIGSTCSE